jgi:hypothetical protein
MLSLDRRTAFARHTQWLALVLEALVLISLLASAVPLALAQPVWWLRISDAAVNLAPILLLAVILLRLGAVLLDNDSEEGLLDSDADEARTCGRRSQQLARRWAFVFALLVPLQLIGYAWLWADSDSQLNRQINQGESGIAALRSRIQASRSEAELGSLLAAANPGPLPPLQGGSLAERKQQLSEAIAINTSRISSSLRDQRAETLRTSLPGSLRVLVGALVVSASLFTLSSQMGGPSQGGTALRGSWMPWLQQGMRGTPSRRAASWRALSRMARGRPRRRANSR